jgi:hypothetical protein
MRKNYKQIALKYHEAGLRVIPVTAEKSPALRSWREFQKAQSMQDIERIFENDCEGIALLTGIGEKYKIEVIDIDCKYDLTGSLFSDYVKTLDSFEAIEFSELVVQATRNKGFHLIYKCEENEANKKLAKRPATEEELKIYNESVEEFNKNKEDDQKEKKLIEDAEKIPSVLIETRGAGGYILIEPSDGYRIENGSLFDIPVITPEQRRSIWQAAKTFNLIYSTQDLSSKDRISKTVAQISISDDVKPLDDYNERGDVETLLYSHGWQEIERVGDRIFYRRPNKSKGNSGDFNTKLRLFKTWSTSTQLENEKAYSPSNLYIELEHSGDTAAAAKALYSQSYGSRLESNHKSSIDGLSDSIGNHQGDSLSHDQHTQIKEAEEDFFQKFLKTRFDVSKEPEAIEVVLKISSTSKTYDVGGFGMFGLVVGKEKSGKSTLTSVTVASAIAQGAPLMNMTLDVGDKDIIFLDTEQSNFFYFHTQKKTLKYAGKTDNYDKYHAFSMKSYSVAERIFLIDKLIEHFSNLGLLIIDGVLDLCDNFNNEEKSKATIDHILRWRDTSNALILGILHIGKGQYNNMLGHLGGYASRKCDFAIEVIPNDEEMTTHVRPRLSRFQPFTGFEFNRDEDGVPRLKNSHLNILGSASTGLSERIEEKENKAELEIVAVESDHAQISRAKKSSVNDDDIPF